MTLLLTRPEVAALLNLGECIQAVEHAFRDEALGKIPSAGILGYHVPGGGFHIKAAGAGQYFAAKVNANFPGNPSRHGLPTIQGVVALYDAERGSLLALMDSVEITAQRTAAATAVAAKHLAAPDASVATIVGCGVQGRFQLEALRLVRPLKRAYAVDSEPGRSEHFASEVSSSGLETIPVDLTTAAGESSIIVTCTPSKRAFLSAEQVRPGAFVAAVGADNPEKQEIEPRLLGESRVVVDHLDQCLTIGDLHHAVAAGVMKAGDVAATLGEVIAGIKPGRRSSGDTVVFDSTGTALQDVAAARIVYQAAVTKGIGSRIDF